MPMLLFFQKMLQSKNKANINLAPTTKETMNLKKVPKTRPGSAPITKSETTVASLSAGETDHLRNPDKEYVRPEVFLPEDTEEILKLREELMAEVKSKPIDESISESVS